MILLPRVGLRGCLAFTFCAVCFKAASILGRVRKLCVPLAIVDQVLTDSSHHFEFLAPFYIARVSGKLIVTICLLNHLSELKAGGMALSVVSIPGLATNTHRIPF